MQRKCPQCHRPWHHLDGFIVSSHAHTLMSMPQLVFVRTYQNRPPTPSWTVFKHKSSEWFKIHICLFILFPGWESKTLEPCCAQKSRSLGSSCPMPILCYSDLCVKVSFSVTLSPLEWDFYRSLSACIQNQKQLWNQTLFTHRKKNSGRSSKCWETLKTITTKHFYLSSCVSFFFSPRSAVSLPLAVLRGCRVPHGISWIGRSDVRLDLAVGRLVVFMVVTFSRSGNYLLICGSAAVVL